MKKLISALLILTMLASVVCVSTSAATMYVDVDFKSEDQFLQHFMPGAFFVEEGLLYGYDEARALQSNYALSEETYKWLTYDSSVTIALADDDVSENQRVVSLVYCNDNLMEYGRADGGVYMSFVYDVDEGCFRLATGLHGSYPGGDDKETIMEPVYREIVDTDLGEDFFTLGMSVEKDRIRCFYNDELIYDFVDTARDWLIADSVTSPFLFWQNGNFIQFSNIKIAEAGYLFPHADVPVTSETTAPVGDNDVTTTADKGDNNVTTTPKVTTTAISDVVVTDKDGNEVTDASGNKVTSQVVITEAPSAATNTGKPAGGNATATGDATFVVVAAMVATLGCALIVRKASVR